MNTDNLYAAPKADISPKAASSHEDERVYQHGKWVITHEEELWPNRCYQCNAPTGNTKSVKLIYFNPWFYLTILISWLITVVLYFIFRKQATIELPICEFHEARWKKHQTIRNVLGILLVLTVGIIMFVLIQRIGDEMLVWFLSALAAVFLLALIIMSFKSQKPRLTKYVEGTLWIRGTGQAFRDSLQEHDG